MAYKQRIKLIVTTADSVSTSEIKAPHITNTMYDAAWDLIYTLSTNKRRTSSLYTQNQKKKAKAAARKPKKLMKLTKRTPRPCDNSARTGIHAMVEGNRGDHQT